MKNRFSKRIWLLISLLVGLSTVDAQICNTICKANSAKKYYVSGFDATAGNVTGHTWTLSAFSGASFPSSTTLDTVLLDVRGVPVGGNFQLTCTAANTCGNRPVNISITVVQCAITTPDTVMKTTNSPTPINVGPALTPVADETINARIEGPFHNSGTASINPTTGVVTFTPNPILFVGQDTIRRIVCKTPGVCDTSLIIIDNKAPNNTVRDTTNMNTPKTLASLTPLTFEGGTPTTTTSSAKVTVTLGVPTYTPTSGFIGMDTQYVYRCDGASPQNCDTTRLIMTVLPNIADSVKGTTVNTPVSIGPAVTPSPNITQTVTASNGTPTINPDGTVKYTPNPNFVGTDTVKRIVCTTIPVYCDTSLMIINVAPKYNDTTVTTPMGTAKIAGTPVLIMPGSTTAITTTGPSNGSTVVNPTTGVVTYTPNPSFIGRDTVTRKVCVTFADATTKCDTSLIVFVVSPKLPDTKDSTPMNVAKTVGSPVTVGPGTSATTVASAKKGTLTVNPNGTVNFTPLTGFIGIDTITREVCVLDSGTMVRTCDTSLIEVIVYPKNADSTKATNENTPVAVGPAVTPGPGITDNSTASKGTVTNNPDGTITYTPNTNWVGTDTVKRQVCVTIASVTRCDTQNIIVNVAPKAPDDSKTTPQGTPVMAGTPIKVMPGSDTTVTLKGPSNGTAVKNPDGTVTYTPNPNFVGRDTVKREVCVIFTNTTSKCDTALLVFVVTPKAIDSKDTTPLNVAKTVGSPVTAGPGTSVSTVPTAKKGTVTTNPNGTINFTPLTGFIGLDTITKVVCMVDSSTMTSSCNTSIIEVIVYPKNADSTKATNENTPVAVGPAVTPGPGITDNSTASKGTVTNNPDGTITYTPNTNWVGTDTVKRAVCVTTTGGTTCDVQNIVINVLPKAPDDTKTTPQGTPVMAGTPIKVMPGSDTTVTLKGPSNGTALKNPDGTVTYTPNPTFIGRDTVKREVCVTFTNGNIECDTALLIFVVTPNIPDTKDSVPMNGGPKLTGSPVSGPGITVAASAKKGTVTVNPDGTVNYKPNPTFTGIDTITRIVCDTTPMPDACDTSLIIMKVTPLIKGESVGTPMNTPISMGDPITLGPGASQRFEGPKNGTVSVNPDGTLKYTPTTNFVGQDTIRHIVCVEGSCDTAEFIIRVEPAVADKSGNTKDGTPVTISGPGLIPGAGTSIDYTKAGGPSNGTASVNPTTGAVTYTPTPGFTGKDTVKVSVCVTFPDATIVCDTHLVIITVDPTNKTNPDIADGNKGEQITGNVSTNDNVIAGTTYGTPVAASSNPSGTLPVMNANGSYTFTATVPGVYVFNVPVCPPGQTAGCPTETLTITVLDPTLPNKPVVNDDYPITQPNTPVKVDVLANDAGGNVGFPLVKSSLTVATSPKNGTATVNPDGTITYTPNTGFVGMDTFSYTICDSMTPRNCATAFVYVNVSSSALAEVQDDIARGSGILSGNTLSNDKFPAGSKPRVVPQKDVIVAGKGKFSIDSAGNFTWTPDPGFSGSVQMIVTTCDGLTPENCYRSTVYLTTTKTVTNAVIPNYFSPNGDGSNDVWNIDAILDLYPNARALIYNRWGNIVWRSTGPYGRSNTRTNNWYGQQEGSTDNVPDGVYYYLLELEDEFKTTKTGFIEIMRQ